MVKAKKLDKSYGSTTLLSEVSFGIELGQKVALVGPNGSGKTTLLKIIAGIEDPDSGTLHIAKNTHIGYLPQEIELSDENKSIHEYLLSITGLDVIRREMEHAKIDPDTADYSDLFETNVVIMMAGFGMSEIGLDTALADLSTGQKSKVAFIGVLLSGFDLLLLDEPTNNLDLPALIWLEEFLKKTDASCIVVSHDRRFLDAVTDGLFEIDELTKTLRVSKGSYSDYLARKEKLFARQKEQYRIQQEEISRLRGSAEKKRSKASKGSKWKGSDKDKLLRGFKRDRAGQSSRAAKAIEKRIEKIDKVKKPFEKDLFMIPIDPETENSTLDIQLYNVVAGYRAGFSVGTITLHIPYGSRLGLFGLNGTGKSTLLKTITGEMQPISGEVRIGSGVRIGNLMQDHRTLPLEETLLDFIGSKAGISIEESYHKLVKFGFSRSQASSTIQTLSPGERARLVLALFSALSVNTLVLDEPTNHLDIEAIEALNETLSTYSGTVLLVSHDRHFLERSHIEMTYLLENGDFEKIPDFNVYLDAAVQKARSLVKILL